LAATTEIDHKALETGGLLVGEEITSTLDLQFVKQA
jgi:hypothetical protein